MCAHTQLAPPNPICLVVRREFCIRDALNAVGRDHYLLLPPFLGLDPHQNTPTPLPLRGDLPFWAALPLGPQGCCTSYSYLGL